MFLDEGAIRGRAAEMAAALAARGFSGASAEPARSRVAARATNDAAFVAFREAAATLGLYVVPLHPKWTEREVDVALAKTGATLVDLESIRGTGRRETTLDLVGPTILLTSGTTGSPKACLRPEAAERARADEITATYGLSRDDVHLIACPLAHSAPGIFLRACRRAGARTFLMPRFDAAPFAAALRATRATVFFLVPTQVERLLTLPRSAIDWESTRAFIVAGAPFAPATKQRLIDWIGPGKLWEFYGSSETGTISVAPPSSQPGTAGFVGWPPPGVSVRVDDSGEIWVKSPAVMDGYLGDEASWCDGYLSVGDLGVLRDDGAIVLTDRKHDTIISGGVNVYPAEVERALLEHPAVEAAVVCGIPDADWGEAVAAVVAIDSRSIEFAGRIDSESTAAAGRIDSESTAAAGRVDSESIAAALRAHLRDRLAAYKIPKRFRFCSREEIPIGGTGKPLRRAARALFDGRP